MKTKLDELRAAYEASTPGEWEPLMTCGELHVCVPVNEGCDVGTVCAAHEDYDTTFIAQAHNLMPQLLEAVGVLRQARTTLGEVNDIAGGPIRDTIWYSGSETLFDYIDATLEKLK